MSFHAPPGGGRIADHPTFGSCDADGANGAFILASPEPGWALLLILSDQPLPPDPIAWEHVSVHAFNKKGTQRTPTWREMTYVKDHCWDPDDSVIQFHPARSSYVNTHPHTLHLWRPVGVPVLMPPIGMV